MNDFTIEKSELFGVINQMLSIPPVNFVPTNQFGFNNTSLVKNINGSFQWGLEHVNSINDVSRMLLNTDEDGKQKILQKMADVIEKQQEAQGNKCKVSVTEEMGPDGQPKFVAHMEPINSPSGDSYQPAYGESPNTGGSPTSPAAGGQNPMQQMMQPFMQAGQQAPKMLEGLTKMGGKNPIMELMQKLPQQIQQWASQAGQGGASGSPTSDTMTQGDTMEDKNHDGKDDNKEDGKDHDGKSDSDPKHEMKYVAPTPTGGLSTHGGNNIVDLGSSTPVTNPYGQTTDTDPNQLAPFSPVVPKK